VPNIRGFAGARQAQTIVWKAIAAAAEWNEPIKIKATPLCPVRQPREPVSISTRTTRSMRSGITTTPAEPQLDRDWRRRSAEDGTA
jgi:hypothetical protein